MYPVCAYENEGESQNFSVIGAVDFSRIPRERKRRELGRIRLSSPAVATERRLGRAARCRWLESGQ